MSDIKFIEGGIFTDYRGQISHVNDLDMQAFLYYSSKDCPCIRIKYCRMRYMTAGDMTRICGWIGIYGRLIPVVVRVRCPGRFCRSSCFFFH